jgi:pSer/pThr/pTyr-binding forkhead associated (FHA) protein
MPSLIFVTGPLAGRRVEVRTELVLGRQAGDVVLDDPEVSRRHAVVRAGQAGLEVADLGSLNGTWVNGARITRATRLVPGDRVRLGGVELAVAAEPTRATAAAAAGPAPAARAPAPPLPAFAPPPNPARRRIATRRLTPTLLAFAAVVATAIALVAYFAGR